MGQSVDDTSPIAGETQPKAKTNLLARSLAVAASSNPSGVLGLDVSGWQADPATYTQSQVNWTTQWNLGGRFVYAKATEGTSMVDGSRNSHLAGAKAVGMLTGAYHFALPSQSSALAQANFFVQNGGGWKANSSTLPPLLDIENNPYSSLGNSCYGMTPAAMVAWIKAFSSRIQALTGRLPAIYTNYYWWLNCTGNSTAFTNQPLHIAAYGTSSPWMPGGWTNYSFWQYSDNGPFAGDSNTWNGTLANLKTFAAQASATTPPVTPPVVTPPAQPSITSPADIVTADAAGLLWDYPATGAGVVGTPRQIGAGWKGLRSINVIDWNNDGTLDIIAQWNSGALTFYKGNSTGGFASAITLGSSGWGGYQLSIGYWLTNSNYPQILSRSDSGELRLWRNTSGSSLDGGTGIGSGWAGLNMTMVDFDGDGNQDLLVQDSSGYLRLYRSNGLGRFIDEARKQVGNGWNTFTSLTVYGGFQGSASTGLIGRSVAGALSYIPIPGNSTFGSFATIGNGWSSMLIAGGENINLPLPPQTPLPPSVSAGSKSVTATASGAPTGPAAKSLTITLTPGGASCTVAATAGACTISNLSNGTAYTAVAKASNAQGTSTPSGSSTSVTPLFPVQRIGGADRYEVSAAVSANTFSPGVSVAYIASGTVFSDALSGAAAAGQNQGPVLLTAPSALSAPVKAELARLKPKKIVVLGGTASVSDAVLSGLSQYSSTVQRIGGPDRYAVSANVSSATFAPNVSVAYVASGAVFTDALSAAAAAGTVKGPVLLSSGTGLSGNVKAELLRLKPQKIMVLGSSASIDASVFASLKSYSPTVQRIDGTDRYAVSASTSQVTFVPGVKVAYVASGGVFADALSGAAAAGTVRGPVLLSPVDGLSAQVQAELFRLKPQRVVILGGTSSIGSAVEDSLARMNW